jgi:hypothetical protein
MACSVIVNAPEINDCEAMMVAAVASATIGHNIGPVVNA